MIGIVLAGGKGSRMESSEEKLLLKYKEPIILHVAQALSESDCFSKIIFLTSKNSPKTKSLLLEKKYEILDTPGKGYVEDLNLVLKKMAEPVFITSGDLPLLDKEIIKKIVKFYEPKNLWTTILVTKKFLESIGNSCVHEIFYQSQLCCFTGVSMVNSKGISDLDNVKEKFVIIDDKRIGFNVNTKQDYELLNAA